MKKNTTNRDILGISPYVNAIVEGIDKFFKEEENKRESSFNILISAQWGMGKTFILKKVAKGLTSKGFRTFLFNPWKYSQNTMAIKRKFLQTLHEEFGGRVNLDSLYEGTEGEKHRNLVSEVVFITSGLFRVLIYSLVTTLVVYGLLQLLVIKFPDLFQNFFIVLFTFLKISTELKAQNYLIEIAVIVGLLGALVPTVRFVFENISIKTKKAEVDSLEQFEEIFSKIIEQKRHATILWVWVFVLRLTNSFWELLTWDIFFLTWLDEWKLRPYNLYKKIQERVNQNTKQLKIRIAKFLGKHPNLKSISTIVVSVTKQFRKDIIDESIKSLTQDKYPKIAILIDDLDRCEEKEVKNILDGFLTFFEKKNCAYIVTADHTVIEKHIGNQLKLRPGDMISPQEIYSSPKEYLHKIFNLNFLVPSPPKNSLETFLRETATGFGLKSNEFIEGFAYNFFNRNPRAIRRFYTKVKFNIDVAKNLINNPKTEQERKFVAERVIKKPELAAKISSLEMATPKFFSLIVKDPQIAEDCEAEEGIDRTKLYFSGTNNIESKVKEWTSEDREEIYRAERILISEPFPKDSGLGYEMLINFSQSTHSTTGDTFDWSQIQQDMEKGNPVFKKIYRGTTNNGREAIRKQAMDNYKKLKASDAENRHLFLQGMIEVAQASYRKDESKEGVTTWGTDILNELASEKEEYVAKIEPKDYAKLLEVFSDSATIEKEILIKLLSTDPYRKPSVNLNIFQLSEIESTKEEDGKPSQTARDIVRHTSEAFKMATGKQIDSSYQKILIEIFTTNYKTEEQSIPQNHRINYLNSLISLLVQKYNVSELKNNLDFVTQLDDKALLNGITQESWGLVASVLGHEDIINYLNDTVTISPPVKTKILEGIVDKIASWNVAKTLKILEYLQPLLNSLPQSKEQLSEEQKLALEIFLVAITAQQSKKSVGTRKFITSTISSFLALLTEDEKNKVTSVYQTGIDTTNNLSQLREIKSEVEKIGFSDVVKTAEQKISSIKRKKPNRKPRLKYVKQASSKHSSPQR